MTKLAFLSALRSKLGILNADEINDIIDEYSGYIDSKIAEGKSEEEAVRDFGSVEDLAYEILDAYKINKEYSKEYTKDDSREKNKETSNNKSTFSRQTTIDDFVNTLGDILNQTIEYATRFFRNVFQDYSVESLAQLLVIFLVAIIIIAIMKIPFFIIENIGSSFIHFILPYRAARFLVFVWEILVNIIYFLISILVIAGLIQGVMDKKDIGESIRDMFQRSARSMKSGYRSNYDKQKPMHTGTTKAKSKRDEAGKPKGNPSKTTIVSPASTTRTSDFSNDTDSSDISMTQSTVADKDTTSSNQTADPALRVSEPITLVLNDEPVKYYDTDHEPESSDEEMNDFSSHNTEETGNDLSNESMDENNEELNELEVDEIDKSVKTRSRKAKKIEYEPDRPPYRESRTWIESILEMMIGLLKIFVLLVLIPFYGAMLGIAIAIGAMIYLLFQGISIFGFIILALGILAILGTCTSFVWYTLDRKKSYRIHSYKASIMTACVLLGFGGVFSFFDVMRFEYDPSPEVFATFPEKKNLYYDLSDKEQSFQFGTSQIMLVEDSELPDTRIKVQLQYHSKDAYLDEYTEEETTYIFVNQYGNHFGEFKFVIDTLIEGLKDNKIYNADYYSRYVVHVHGNANTLKKLSLRYNKVTFQP